MLSLSGRTCEARRQVERVREDAVVHGHHRLRDVRQPAPAPLQHIDREERRRPAAGVHRLRDQVVELALSGRHRGMRPSGQRRALSPRHALLFGRIRRLRAQWCGRANKRVAAQLLSARSQLFCTLNCISTSRLVFLAFIYPFSISAHFYTLLFISFISPYFM